MGQVPQNSLLLIGRGRLARHLLHYHSLFGIQCLNWHRGESHDALAERIQRASRVGILLSDQAIAPFFMNHQNLLKNKVVFHCSGALSHPQVESAHPLMTFSPALYEKDFYPRITFVTEQGRASFKDLFPELPNPSVSIPSEQKPFYHALCVASGNLTTLLLGEVAAEMTGLKIPISALELYMQKTLKNFFESPFTSLTGPLARADVQTVQANLRSLRGQRLEAVYRQFVSWFPKFSDSIEGGKDECAFRTIKNQKKRSAWSLAMIPGRHKSLSKQISIAFLLATVWPW